MLSASSRETSYAGLTSRGLAYLLDCTFSFALFAASQLLLLTPLRGTLGIGEGWFHSGLNTQLYTLLTISLPIWLYFALFEGSSWQATPGKRLLKLRVVRAGNGERIGFPRALLRTVVKLLPWEIAHLTNNLPEPIWYARDPGLRPGFLVTGVLVVVYVVMVGLQRKRQGPHDQVAGTVVVRG